MPAVPRRHREMRRSRRFPPPSRPAATQRGSAPGTPRGGGYHRRPSLGDEAPSDVPISNPPRERIMPGMGGQRCQRVALREMGCRRNCRGGAPRDVPICVARDCAISLNVRCAVLSTERFARVGRYGAGCDARDYTSREVSNCAAAGTGSTQRWRSCREVLDRWYREVRIDEVPDPDADLVIAIAEDQIPVDRGTTRSRRNESRPPTHRQRPRRQPPDRCSSSFRP